MCLILVAWKAHPSYPLVVAANRDEFHARPTAPAAFWQDQPAILAGRDLECMGTWLGVTRSGKFAAVSNFREGVPRDPVARSRGLLASIFLSNHVSAQDFARKVAHDGPEYSGFNFLAGDRDELWWVSNRNAGARRLAPGIYGVSNHLLDTPWVKVVRGKRALGDSLLPTPAIEPLLALLADTTVAADDELPDTGVGPERERLLSSLRVVSDAYGTRCSSAVIVGSGGRVQFAERSYGAQGEERDTVRYEFALEG
ncbi:MAG: NRDE family protein [Sphingomonadaceae bacterium]